MGQLVDRDVEHLKLLEWGFYLMTGISGMVTLFAALYLVVGSAILATVGQSMKQDNVDPAMIASIIFLVGGIFVLISATTTFVMFYAARGLRFRRRRTLCMIVAGIFLFYIPWGTALGIATFYVLGRPSVQTLFNPTAAPVVSAV